MAGGLVGYLQYAALMVTSIPIWFGGLLGLFLSFIQRPRTFLYRKDRTKLRFDDACSGLQHEYHLVNGVKLHVVVGGRPAAGAPKKKLMLFVHGFPEAHFSWRHQLAAFQDDYEVAALDLRGYGKSDKPKGRRHYRLFEIVQDLKELVEALGHKRFILVGHDWGAVASWRFAAYHQDMLEALVCMSAPPGQLWTKNQDAEQKRKSAYVWLFQLPLLPELLIAAHDFEAIDKAFTDSSQMGVQSSGAISEEDVEHYKALFAEPGALTAALNYYRAFVDSATWNPQPRTQAKPAYPIRVPTLVICGENDGALGRVLFKGLDAIVTGARVEFLPDCSHWVQQDKPDEVNALMRRFLAG
jgi:pimeloyl-ACP methyl ester carboxylesterase